MARILFMAALWLLRRLDTGAAAALEKFEMSGLRTLFEAQRRLVARELSTHPELGPSTYCRPTVSCSACRADRCSSSTLWSLAQALAPARSTEAFRAATLLRRSISGPTLPSVRLRR